MPGIKPYSLPVILGLSATAVIFILNVLFNSSVMSFRLRELDRALEAAAKVKKQNRNLGMLIQYELLQNRLGKEQEDEADYRTEAELQALITPEIRDDGSGLKKLLDPLAFGAIRVVRSLMGKETESVSFDRPSSSHLQAAYYFERNRQYKKAIIEYEIALEQEPALRAEILLHLGFCYSLLSEFDRARLLFRQVADTYPGQEEAAVAIKLYQKLEVIDQSIKRVVQVSGEKKTPFKQAKILYRLMRYRDALKILAEIAQKETDHPRIHEILFLAGRCYEETGRDSLATDCYTNLVTYYPVGSWTKKANQRLLMIASFYKKDVKKAQEINDVLINEFMDNTFSRDITQIKQEISSRTEPGTDDSIPADYMAAEKIESRIAAPSEEEKEEYKLARKTSEILTAAVKSEKAERQRARNRKLWQEEHQNYLAEQKSMEEQKQREEKENLELQEILKKEFAAAEKMRMEKERERQELARKTAQKERREREQRLAQRRAREEAQKRIRELKEQQKAIADQFRIAQALEKKAQEQRLKREKAARKELEKKEKQRLAYLRKEEKQRKKREKELAEKKTEREKEIADSIAAAEEYIQKASHYRITWNSATYRDRPSRQGKILGRLFRAQHVVAESISGEWLHVRLDNGEMAWILDKFCKQEMELDKKGIKDLEKLAEKEEKEWIVTRDSIMVRKSPGAGTIITTLYAGEEVVLLKEKGNQLQVRTARGEKGWINSRNASWKHTLARKDINRLVTKGKSYRKSRDLILEEKRREEEIQKTMRNALTASKFRNKQLVQKTLSGFAQKWMRVYSERQAKKPDLKGMIKLGFVITPEGGMDSLKILSSTVKDDVLERKIMAILGRARFKSVPVEIGNTPGQYIIPLIPVEK
jgi:hypothetical protein